MATAAQTHRQFSP